MQWRTFFCLQPNLVCIVCTVHYNLKDFFIVLTNSYLNDSYTSCSGARAPGLAADMHFRDKVVAFIGPACAFALEPVARLAAYWNRPIITGMGDQVSDTNLDSM